MTQVIKYRPEGCSHLDFDTEEECLGYEQSQKIQEFLQKNLASDTEVGHGALEEIAKVLCKHYTLTSK